MESERSSSIETHLPALRVLGYDLLRVTPMRRLATILLPFAAMGCYALCAWLSWWPLAVLAVMMLSFVTYGSTSHDLVHRTLRLSPRVNDLLLSLIELLSLRSGTAYRLTHLHHHKHLLAPDDIEGDPAHGTLLGAIASGPTMQIRLWVWAWGKHKSARPRLLVEAIGIIVLIAGAMALYSHSAVPLFYVALAIAGSWVFPLATVYLPHDAKGETTLAKTRLFRGRLFRIVAFDHLYHLEHHLYPAVPHHHWPTLAARLEPHLTHAGVRSFCDFR